MSRNKHCYAYNNAYFDLAGSYDSINLIYSKTQSWQQASWAMSYSLAPNSKYLILCITTSDGTSSGLVKSTSHTKETFSNTQQYICICNDATGKLYYVETGESAGTVKMYHTMPSNGGWAIGGGLAIYGL